MGRIESSDTPGFLVALGGNIREKTDFTEKVKDPEVLWLSDMEGPLDLGDTAAEVMKERVKNGDWIYKATYDWYTDLTGKKRNLPYNWFENPEEIPKVEYPLAQEGGDIVLALAPLLAVGVTEEDIRQEALEFVETPGAREFVKYLKDNKGLVIAVTTAWQPVADVIAEKFGGNEVKLDGAIGTPFPIDQAKELLLAENKWEAEMAMVNEFLGSCQKIIERMQAENQNESGEIYQQLKNFIGDFYINKLGVTFGRSAETQQEKSLLGQIIDSIQVVGDVAKAEIAQQIIRNNPGDEKQQVFIIGDGRNDGGMLSCLQAEGAITIGLNGPVAVQSAQIGLVTPNVYKPLKAIIEAARSRSYGINNLDLIEKVQKMTGKEVLVHRGGVYLPVDDDLVQKHNSMKKQLREEAGGMVLE